MGAISGKRIDTKVRIRIVGKHGPVAQLLHPYWITRNDVSDMGRILQRVDSELSQMTSGVRLVVSGGGFIELRLAKTYSHMTWKSEKTLSELSNLVQERMQIIATALKESGRDYVIGVDVFDGNCTGGGQFAAFLSAGVVCTIAWKSYPVGDESKWLAGFGSNTGRNSPRIVLSVLGKATLLICHDSQAFNHRNLALIHRAYSATPRQQAVNSMINTIKAEKPEWAFSLIHQIDKIGSIRTFRNSYTQICRDYQVSAVVGSFGYGKNVQKNLESLASRAQYPDGKAGVIAVLEVK